MNQERLLFVYGHLVGSVVTVLVSHGIWVGNAVVGR